MSASPCCGARAGQCRPCAPAHTPNGSKDAVNGSGETYLRPITRLSPQTSGGHMFIRRLAASAACALSLAVPAAALAVPVQDPSTSAQPPTVVYGDANYDLQNQQDLSAVTVSGVTGDTKSDLKPATPSAG